MDAKGTTDGNLFFKNIIFQIYINKILDHETKEARHDTSLFVVCVPWDVPGPYKTDSNRPAFFKFSNTNCCDPNGFYFNLDSLYYPETCSKDKF